jgi:hypothetical protein
MICILLRTVDASYEHTVNVGTVLFSRKDVQKLHWSKTEIGLLRARRYFQELLPPPNIVDATNEAYVDSLLNYFRETFCNIKKVSANDVSDSIMTAAFSDAIGGYLNLWVLPITKLAFYGGTISQNNIMKLYQFYNELKRFLDTDGKTWKRPDKNLLNTITMSIASPRHINRSMKNACTFLAFYEKFNTGLSIPTPYINWEDKSSTMFIPFRNHSLISLDSPNYPNALVKYYDTAKSCLQCDANNPTQINQFDYRFQDWLAKEVVPHLSDDNLYLALGNVLSLVNKTHFHKLLNFKMSSLNKKVVIAGIPIDLSNKKMLIIVIILILEVAWCIPALLYLACAKRKKKATLTRIFNKVKKKRPCNKCKESDCCHDKSKKTKSQGDICESNQKIHKLQTHNLDCEPCVDSNLSVATTTTVSIVHEAKQTPLKSSLKKMRSNHTQSQHTISLKQSKSKSCCFSTSMKHCTCSNCSLVESIKDLEKFYPENDTKPEQFRPVTFENSIKSIVEAISLQTTQIKSSSENTLKKVKSAKTSANIILDQTLQECPCLKCEKIDTETDSQVTVIAQPTKEVVSDKSFGVDIVPFYPVMKETVKRNVGLRLESGHPILEIMIEKPQTEISVGIGGVFDPFKGRRSKIPKRLPGSVNVQMTCETVKKQSRPVGKKSLIPQPKRRPVDDLAINSNKTKNKSKDNKLNVTL